MQRLPEGIAGAGVIGAGLGRGGAGGGAAEDGPAFPGLEDVREVGVGARAHSGRDRLRFLPSIEPGGGPVAVEVTSEGWSAMALTSDDSRWLEEKHSKRTSRRPQGDRRAGGRQPRRPTARSGGGGGGILDSISIHWAAVVGARETERGRGVLRFLYGRACSPFTASARALFRGSVGRDRNGPTRGRSALLRKLWIWAREGADLLRACGGVLLLGLSGALPLPTATLRVMTLDASTPHSARNHDRAWLIERFNRRKRSLDIQLSYMGKPRLADIDDPEQEISTSSRETLRRTLERMPGGAIGLAGLAASARAL